MLASFSGVFLLCGRFRRCRSKTYTTSQTSRSSRKRTAILRDEGNVKKKQKQKKNTITAYVKNVSDADPTVDSVSVSYSGKAFHTLMKAMMLAGSVDKLNLVVEGGDDTIYGLRGLLALECAAMLQRAVDEMAEES